jgi:hypothetical protein
MNTVSGNFSKSSNKDGDDVNNGNVDEDLDTAIT